MVEGDLHRRSRHKRRVRATPRRCRDRSRSRAAAAKQDDEKTLHYPMTRRLVRSERRDKQTFKASMNPGVHAGEKPYDCKTIASRLTPLEPQKSA